VQRSLSAFLVLLLSQDGFILLALLPRRKENDSLTFSQKNDKHNIHFKKKHTLCFFFDSQDLTVSSLYPQSALKIRK